MNNAKFMEISNDELMEIEGGVALVWIAVGVVCVGAFILGFSNGKRGK